MIPTGLSLPYSASSVMPATIVGSANGRSIIELMSLLPGKSSRTRTQAIAVPTTHVDHGDDERGEHRQPQRVERLRVGGVVPERAETVLERLRKTTAASGISTMMLSHVTTIPRDSRALPRRGLKAGLGSDCRRLSAAAHQPVVTPRSRSISATEPFSGSKNSVVTVVPATERSSMSNRPFGVGNSSSFSFRTSGSTGR